MATRSTCTLLALLAFPAAVSAQHGNAAGAPPATTAPAEASQWEFLIGQWELVVRPQAQGLAARIHGAPRLAGTWKAWRALDGWGVEDELRIVDGSGNPLSLSHTVRVYDATARHWSLSLLDVYRGRFTTATAEWRDGRMQVTGRGTDQEGRPYVSRTRYSDITRDGFRMQQDRSLDDGKTWTEAVLRIEAKRVAATAPR
jgi:hypothetical protein